MNITSKQLHDEFGFKYGWIKNHFACIKLDFKIERANAYDIFDMTIKAKELYRNDLECSHTRQNYTRTRLLERLIAVLSDYENKKMKERQ